MRVHDSIIFNIIPLLPSIIGCINYDEPIQNKKNNHDS